MKLQIEANLLRFRISEAELVDLMAGRSVIDQTQTPDGVVHGRQLRLQTLDSPLLSWQAQQIELILPRAAVDTYITALPRKDALRFQMGAEGGLQLDFEVDVRDSVRTRLPAKQRRT